MKKVKLLLAIIFLSFVGFLLGWFKIFNTIQAPQTANPQTENLRLENESPNENSVSLQIDFGDGKTTSFEKVLTGQEQTAYSLLTAAAEDKNLDLQTQEYDFGVFVKSINGYESTADKAWIYFVNGESGTIAADKYKLAPGDKVEWKYIPPTNE
jgi:LAS superfamily LD-carboxypeptidase LdcB